MDKTKPKDRILTFGEAANEFNLDLLDLYKWRDDGKFHHYDADGLYFVTESDLKQWLDRKDCRVTKSYSQKAIESCSQEEEELYKTRCIINHIVGQLKLTGQVVVNTFGNEEILYSVYDELDDEPNENLKKLMRPAVESDKNDKPPLTYIWDFAEALEELSKVFAEGSRKYGRGSWRTVGYKFSDRCDSLNRHLCNRMKGEKLDHDSGRNNLIMVAWNAMFLYMLEEGLAEGEVDL